MTGGEQTRRNKSSSVQCLGAPGYLAAASTDYKNLAKGHLLTYTAPTREGQ